MTETRDLQSIRETIEEIDREILAQIRRRMSIVEEVAAVKLQAAYPFTTELRILGTYPKAEEERA